MASPIIINGMVQQTNTTNPYAKIKIELWDASSDYGWIASTYSKHDGSFQFIIPDPASGLIQSEIISLQYKLYYDEELLLTVDNSEYESEVIINIPENSFDEIIKDDFPQEKSNDYLVVTGTVKNSNGVPLINTTVNIYETGFRQQILVGVTTTDDNGVFSIKLNKRLLKHTSLKGRGNIRAEAINEEELVLAFSENYSYQGNQIDITLVAGSVAQSEFTSLSAIIENAIGGNSIASITLNEEEKIDEFAYVAEVTEKDRQKITELVKAYQYAEASSVSADIVYSVLKKHGTDADPLVKIKASELNNLIAEATSAGLIPSKTSGEINTAIAAVKAYQVEQAKSIPIRGESFPLQDVLDSFLGNPSETHNFLTLFHSSDYESTAAFWTDYQTYHGSTQREIAQRGMHLAGITGFQPEIIEALMDHSAPEDGGLANLAKWPLDSWINLVSETCSNSDRLCVPSAIRGEVTEVDSLDIQTEYAARLREVIQDIYPLTAINVVLDSDTGDELIGNADIKDDVITFINNNPAFDLRKVSAFDVDNEDWNLSGISNVDGLKEGLLPFQRILRITNGKPDAAVAMKVNNHDSSETITSLSEDEFIALYEDAFGSVDAASQVYAQALTVNATVNLATVETAGRIGGPVIAVLPDDGFDPVAQPTLATMFGTLDLCSCRHCLSMYSPAAYYTDILHFLKKNSGTQHGHASAAYTELMTRRPDLQHIDLTCKNTNTPVPYVDLINELMESEILRNVGGGAPTPPNSFQTSANANVLAAHPEHVYKNSGVYQEFPNYKYVYENVLKNQKYPLNLPYNFALETSRVYLKHLGKSRHDLMTLFEPPALSSTTSSKDITKYNLLNEYLGISKEAADIIIDTHNASVWQYYGFSGSSVSGYLSPSDTSVTLSGNWADMLSGNLSAGEGGIDVLLQQLKITYKELLQLLQTGFLNPVVSGNRRVELTARSGKPADTCVLKFLRLAVSNLPAGVTAADYWKMLFDKMHRFVRLLRASKLSIYELDVLLTHLCSVKSVYYTVNSVNFPGDLTADTYQLAVRTIKLAAILNIKVETMITQWSSISVQEYTNFDSETLDTLPSLYAGLFKNKAVINLPASSYVNPFDNYSSLPSNLLDHTAIIASVAQVSEQDILAIFEALYPGTTTFTNQLQTISRVYFLASLARGMRVRVPQLLTIMRMYTGTDTMTSAFPFLASPFMASSIADYYDQVEGLIFTRDIFASSNFSLEEADYLVLNIDHQEKVAPKSSLIQIFYENLRKELQKFPAFNPAYPSSLTPEEEELRDQLRNIVLLHYSKEFNIPTRWVELIFEGIPSVTTPVVALTIEDIIDHAFVTDTAAIVESLWASLFNDMYDAYRRMHKITMITIGLGWKLEEFEDVFARQSQLGFDFSDLDESGNYITPTVSVNLLIPFLRLIVFTEVIRMLVLKEKETGSFLDAMNGAAGKTKQDLVEIIQSNTDWGDLLTDLIGSGATSTASGHLQVAYSDFATTNLFNLLRLKNIRKIITWSRSSGIKPNSLFTGSMSALWSDLTLDEAHKILDGAKGKHDEASWAKVAKPLRDPLREQQRKALVAYMIHNNHGHLWRNENHLYAYYLIDVEMQPCMMTSRLKQAISSVQLFMDRLAMGLECYGENTSQQLFLEEKYVKQWEEWRKWYRIWEANRKIFLYPENWIEPDLRDGKSPFFEELEIELMQNDITDEHVKKVMHSYLTKLDEVARLEPVGTCDTWDAIQQKTIVHAFSRTYSDPHVHYYRRMVDWEWTPWEKIEIDIKSNHVVPYVINNRLFLFWLTFREKQIAFDPNSASASKWRNNQTEVHYFYNEQSRNINGDNNGQDKMQKVLEVSLNWSEYKEGKWLKQKISADTMQLKIHPRLEEYIKIWTNGSPAVNTYYSLFTKNYEITVTEFIKRRLFLRTTVRNNYELFHSVCFPALTTHAEDAQVIQTFIFDSNGNNTTLVKGWTLTGDPVMAPISTAFEDGRFRESAIGPAGNVIDGKLWVDSYIAGYNMDFYEYINEKTIKINRNQRNTSDIILDSTGPNGTFKVIPRSNFWHNPLENNFMFYDEVNTYFVHNVDSGAWFQDYIATDPSKVNLSLSGALGNQFYPTLLPASGSPIAGFPATITSNGTLPTLNTLSPVAGFPTGTAVLTSVPPRQYFFQTFYHPYHKEYIRVLNSSGIDGLMNLYMQDQCDNTTFTADPMDFAGKYVPTSLVHPQYPTAKVDFDYFGPYSCYNWELFFHIPMLIAQRLSDNQKFAEARKWYHYIFDPTCSTEPGGTTGSGDKERFWKFMPFYLKAQQPIQTLNDILILINQNDPNYTHQVHKWEENPFKPHVIARIRLLSYMKNVVMKYIDNLIAWGDQLFRRDTIESINEATQLYILALNILGSKPQDIPARSTTSPKSFSQLLAAGLDDLSNAKVMIENYIGQNNGPAYGPVWNRPLRPRNAPAGRMFYFCLSANDKLLEYWNKIADRLFKIRNCQNIEGQERQLPLFEPPIDPALLVRAAAAGVDINSILDEVNSTPNPYRFTYTVQKANEVVNDVKALGGALLSALEKKDAEQLALLRSTQEIALLEKVKIVKQTQVEEASTNLQALELTKENVEKRITYYTTRPYMNAREKEAQRNQQIATTLQAISGEISSVGASLGAIPQFHAQATFSVGPSFGGMNIAAIMQATSLKLATLAAIKNAEGNMAATVAGYDRRMDDWQFQADTARKELEQVNKQIIAAEIRMAVAEKELENHELQMENTQATDDYMRSKFTNQQLYNWMIGQISATYFQAYQLAYDLAKKAENCYKYELNLAYEKKAAVGFVKFGYWDSLRKGLLAGEKLQYDIRKMEIAYMEDNKRELELTKHVSLALTDPEELIRLKQSGTCDINIPAYLYNLDYPGHYNRRIKSVSVSIPCIAGPYTTIAAKLKLLSSDIEDAAGVTAPYGSAIEKVATSNAQGDSGMFELNFRDERYLPFEGRGAISTWELVMMSDAELRQFDYHTISDVILTIKYTAQDSDTKAATIVPVLKDLLEGSGTPNALPRYFSLKHEFSNAWNQYAVTADGITSPTNAMSITITKDHFPYFCKNRALNVGSIYVRFVQKSGATAYKLEVNGTLIDDDDANTFSLDIPADGTLTIKAKQGSSYVNMDTLFDDIYLVTYYTLS